MDGKMDKMLQAVAGADAIEKYELIKRDQIKGSPFCIVETDKGCFVGYGQYRLTEFISREDCEHRINVRDWDLICGVVNATADFLKRMNVVIS